eukprot:TRINITY_DN42082_c0_g1_i1.p1 TRINITY_DN42082_c0_g1~~TRINITY_DN42082_c0_g1_i1.p1  ORF type:complete len:351 (+),score=47.06 TRINITY_DN42082_c0_g1_i1:90-1142(+)
MSLFLEAVSGLVVATSVGLLGNRAGKAVFRSEDVLSGFPRWRWYMSASTQAFVFPALIAVVLSYWPAGLSLDAWFSASAASAGQPSRWYTYALFASQARDMIPRMPAAASKLMVIHHWIVCVSCCLALLTPGGFGIFVAGSFLLECGSMTYNLRTLYGGSTLVAVVYQVCMLASNLAACYLSLLWLRVDSVPAAVKALFFVVGNLVIAGRQRHAIKDLIGMRRQPKETASRPDGIAADGSVKSEGLAAVGTCARVDLHTRRRFAGGSCLRSRLRPWGLRALGVAGAVSMRTFGCPASAPTAAHDQLVRAHHAMLQPQSPTLLKDQRVASPQFSVPRGLAPFAMAASARGV